MFKKLSLVGVFALALTGCASSYDFTPSASTNNILSIDKDNKSIEVGATHANVEITALESEISPWVDPRLKVKITNKSNIIMSFKSSDIRMSFNNFWFDAYEYEIIDDEREHNFKNDDNFRMIHEILPSRSMEIEVSFNAPKSIEYYERKDVLIEVSTDLALFNIIYKIDRN